MLGVNIEVYSEGQGTSLGLSGLEGTYYKCYYPEHNY